MIQEAVQEAVSRAAVEFGRGRSEGREGVALESLGGSVVGMDIEPDIINPPTPLRAALTPTTALGHISMPMRQRILGHKYVDLKSLLLPSERPEGGDERQYLVAEGGRIALGAAPHKEELSVNGWTKAFLRYASIYTEGYPDEAKALIQYMSTVMDLTRIGLGMAWKDYDESFRKAREVSPGAYPWDKPPQMLWMGAVASGVATFQAPDRRGDCSGQARRRPAPPAAPLIRPCFDYNSRWGCRWPGCRFKHTCSICGGYHSATTCRPPPFTANSSAGPPARLQ